MNTVYSTETPIVGMYNYHFDYPRKRAAYRDACYALMDLNKVAKQAPDNLRHYIYKLKQRYLQRLYEQGQCVYAAQDEHLAWDLVYLVDGIQFKFHVPARSVSWPIKEKRDVVVYEYRKEMPRHAARSIPEAIALLEWILNN